MPPAFVQRFTGPVVLSDVVKVTWQATRANDEDVLAVGQLSTLVDLRLSSDRLTDRATEKFANLQQLRRLDLWCRFFPLFGATQE